MNTTATNAQPLFQGQATYSRELLTEFTTAALRGRALVIVLLGVILAVLDAVVLRSAAGIWIIAGWCGIIGGGLFLWLFNPRIVAKNFYAMALEENNGTELTNSVDVFDDKIILTNQSNGNRFEYPFTLMRRVSQTKNLVVITSNAKLNILLEKSKFSTGSADALIMFVKSKIAGGR